jgi:hypothetical protein
MFYPLNRKPGTSEPFLTFTVTSQLVPCPLSLISFPYIMLDTTSSSGEKVRAVEHDLPEYDSSDPCGW